MTLIIAWLLWLLGYDSIEIPLAIVIIQLIILEATNIFILFKIDFAFVVALIAGIIYDDIFAVLAFIPFLSFHPQMGIKTVRFRIILKSTAFALFMLLLIQAYSGHGYTWIYGERSFVSFTENPNMLAFLIVSLYGLQVSLNFKHSTNGQNKVLKFIVFIIVAWLLLIVGSRNAILPVIIVALVDLGFLKKDVNGKWSVILFIIPMLFPLVLISAIGYGFLPKNTLTIIQRDEWANFEILLNTNQGILGLNAFTYLMTNFSLLFGLIYLITGILFCLRRKKIPIIFFAIWLMGTFESHVVSFSYGAGLILLLISNYHYRKPVIAC